MKRNEYFVLCKGVGMSFYFCWDKSWVYQLFFACFLVSFGLNCAGSSALFT